MPGSPIAGWIGGGEFSARDLDRWCYMRAEVYSPHSLGLLVVGGSGARGEGFPRPMQTGIFYYRVYMEQGPGNLARMFSRIS